MQFLNLYLSNLNPLPVGWSSSAGFSRWYFPIVGLAYRSVTASLKRRDNKIDMHIPYSGSCIAAGQGRDLK